MIKYILFVAIISWSAFSQEKILTNSSPLKKSFTISESVSKADWVFFMKSTDAWKRELWSTHQILSDWSWSWRIAWIKACTTQYKEEWCQKLLQGALSDSAMVVRSEAAKAYGLIFANTKNSQITQMLSKAFSRPENIRNGKPLFVKNQILWALWKINGENKIGEKLASNHPQTKKYWKSLQ